MIRAIEINGKTFTPRRPTLNELINILDAPPKVIAGLEVLDVMLLRTEEMRLDDLLTFSNASERDLREMTEQEVALLAASCKEANPRFFQMRMGLSEIGQETIRNQTR